ncbi:MAG: hypothetical protein WCI74_06940 [Actinomycetes bacterium]
MRVRRGRGWQTVTVSIAAGATLVLGLAACGSGASSTQSPNSSQTSSVATRQLTQPELDAALLPASDFPPGLVPQPIVSQTSDFYSSMCPYFTQVGAPLPKLFSSRDYEDSAQGGTPTKVYITAIEQYESPAQAKQAYDDLVKSYASCGTWTSPSDKAEVHVASVTGPTVGQASTYYKSGVAGTTQTFVGISLNGTALVDSSVVDPAFGATSTEAPKPVVELLQKQVPKYLAAAS